MTYHEKLEQTKSGYPFDKWRDLFYPDEEYDMEGMEQYTPENCDAAQAILDELIANLVGLGEHAGEPEKVLLFKAAVLRLNELNDEVEGLIETVEREDLCLLLDDIAVAAGIDTTKYGGGVGIADEWREW